MKVHWACGDVYLKGYINIDIDGYIVVPGKDIAVRGDEKNVDFISLKDGNPNETTIDKYFKFPLGTPPRKFIVDDRQNILEEWQFDNSSVDELVMISSWEHFPLYQIKDHIIPEICRVLKKDGRLIVDFPDIKKAVQEHIDCRPEWCMELIYCNHKNQYSIHHWGYTETTFTKLWPTSYIVKREDIVKHSYPMIGMIVTKQ